MYLLNDILNIILASFRIGAMITAMPVLGMSSYPVSLKAILALMLGASLVKFMGPLPDKLFYHNEVLALVVMREIGIGLFIGLCARLSFAVVSMSLEYASIQMGFSMANIFDPSSFSQVTVLGQLGMIMTVLIFFTANMHHDFFILIAKSYTTFPIGMPDFNLSSMTSTFIAFVKKVFDLSLRISMPVIVVMLIIHTVLGIIAKAAPQMNLFFNVAIIVNVVVGIILTMMMMPHILKGFINMEKMIIHSLSV